MSRIDAHQTDFAIMPGVSLRAVTPSNTVDLSDGIAEYLWINDEGVVAVAVITEGDTDAVTMAVTGPGPFPFRTKRVLVTGTDATDIVAVYTRAV